MGELLLRMQDTGPEVRWQSRSTELWKIRGAALRPTGEGGPPHANVTW
jgi:hypothetical protein